MTVIVEKPFMLHDMKSIAVLAVEVVSAFSTCKDRLFRRGVGHIISKLSILGVHLKKVETYEVLNNWKFMLKLYTTNWL